MQLKVLEFRENFRDESKLDVCIEFSKEVTEYNTVAKLQVYFNEDGDIEDFPAIVSMENKPYYYIAMGKVVEYIMEFKGIKAKDIYDKAFAIHNKYLNERNIVEKKMLSLNDDMEGYEDIRKELADIVKAKKKSLLELSNI